MGKFITIILSILLVLPFSGCLNKAKLIGTWNNDAGNVMIFNKDNSYSVNGIEATYKATPSKLTISFSFLGNDLETVFDYKIDNSTLKVRAKEVFSITTESDKWPHIIKIREMNISPTITKLITTILTATAVLFSL